MPDLRFTAQAQRDLLRLDDFLFDRDITGAEETIDLILSALEILWAHPHVGRPVRKGLRELVISRGKTGYLALYEYLESTDEVLVLGIRHQRELDYRPD